MAVRPINAINLKKYIKGLDVSLPYDKQDKDDVIRQVCCIIDNWPTLTPPNEWVSVEERLPEGNGEYIVTACDEGCPAGEGIWYDTVVVFAEYYDGCWTWNDGTEYDLTDIVTHWMPLPAPPDRRPPEGET